MLRRNGGRRPLRGALHPGQDLDPLAERVKAAHKAGVHRELPRDATQEAVVEVGAGGGARQIAGEGQAALEPRVAAGQSGLGHRPAVENSVA